MKPTHRFAAIGIVSAVLVSQAAGVADAQLLLRDDFDSTDGTGNAVIVDPRIWRLPFAGEGGTSFDTLVGRTLFRGDTAVDLPLQGVAEAAASDGRVAEIHLDTFSPLDPGGTFLGTDLLTKRDFARGGGLSIEARLRLAPDAVAGGVLGGFFTFDVNGDVRDEIDFELLGNQTGPGGAQDILTNVFNDDGFVGPGSAGDSQFVDIAGFDLTQFQDYRIEWTPDAVRWFVNDNLIREVTDDVPDDPQRVHFNIWAPGSDFEAAFNAALQPAATADANQRFTAQIDHVEVNRFNTVTSGNLLTDPGFEFTTPALNQAIGTTTGEWFSFNNAFIATAGVDDSVTGIENGFNIGGTFGPFLGSSNASGFQQQVEASAGEEFEVSVEAFTTGTDSIAGTQNFTILQIGFADSSGNLIEAAEFVPLDGSEFPLLDGRDPNIAVDELVDGVASAVAPEGTAFARVTLLFVQLVNPPAGDFNDDGIVNAADFVVSRDGAALGSGEFSEFVSTFGDEGSLPGGDPGAAFFDNVSLVRLTEAASLVSAATAVPEPGALLLLVIGAGLASASRRR